MTGTKVETCGDCSKHNQNIEVETFDGSKRYGKGVCLISGYHRRSESGVPLGCPEGHTPTLIIRQDTKPQPSTVRAE